MSADNYFLIRRHPNGGYTALMGFESDPCEPTPNPQDPDFPTLDAALTWALDQYSEYGVSVHPDCDPDYIPIGEDTPHPDTTPTGNSIPAPDLDDPFYTEPGQYLFSNTPTYPHDAHWATFGLHVLADAVADHRTTPFEDDGLRPLITSSITDYTPHHNDTFTLTPYCWCDGDEPGHENGCPPNFTHLPTGLTITWYKHAGRGITSNQPRPHNWTAIISDCIQSLQ